MIVNKIGNIVSGGIIQHQLPSHGKKIDSDLSCKFAARVLFEHHQPFIECVRLGDPEHGHQPERPQSNNPGHKVSSVVSRFREAGGHTAETAQLCS
ncbi:hypothetical protein AVEN_160476-1 [Araneus ventricosus]|uniref:Uncharacterized protein n=1 Tax=Araneus ventricosus TaxID=182803 RepID=A0A4Y2PH98_ARAVE|nr:hypothetical protein AVEN_160476-1 [Araneus ventricosus]